MSNVKSFTIGATAIQVKDDVARQSITTIESKIPAQASESNQIADKAFVNSSVQTATANYRGSWETWADVPTYGALYPAGYGGSTIPTVNDYLVVQDASDFGAQYVGTWRFKYTGAWQTQGKAGWIAEYQVNEEPLTAEQIAALNSGITEGIVSVINKVVGGVQGNVVSLGANGAIADSGKAVAALADKELTISTSPVLEIGKVGNLGLIGDTEITLVKGQANRAWQYHFFFTAVGAAVLTFKDSDNTPITISWASEFVPADTKQYEVDILAVGNQYNGLFIEK